MVRRKIVFEMVLMLGVVDDASSSASDLWIFWYRW